MRYVQGCSRNDGHACVSSFGKGNHASMRTNHRDSFTRRTQGGRCNNRTCGHRQSVVEFTSRTRDQCRSPRARGCMPNVCRAVRRSASANEERTRAENAQREARSELDCSTGYARLVRLSPSLPLPFVLSPFLRGLFPPPSR